MPIRLVAPPQCAGASARSRPGGWAVVVFPCTLVVLLKLFQPGVARPETQRDILDVEYMASADNTNDSHYYVAPGPDTPANFRSPVDYADDSLHVRRPGGTLAVVSWYA